MTVLCPECAESFDVRDIPDFLNIEEDFFGRDVVTYICLGCGREVKSFIVGR